jgi:hypothetical protein
MTQTDTQPQRVSIFEDEADFDLSAFAPRPPKSQPKADKEAIRAVAEAKGFPSREPSPAKPATKSTPAPKAEPEPLLQRRYRTGRNRQLNLKVTDEALRKFYAIADEQGIVLGQLFEQAVNALEAEIARTASKGRGGGR